MQRHIVLKICVPILILAISHVALAQVVYSDGVTHTIPGDPAFTNGQSIALQAASGLIINDNALVEGGEVSSNQFAQGEHAISAQAGTSIHQTDGSATGGTGTVNGDLFSSSSISAIGGAGISTNGSYVGIGGEIFGGFAYANALYDDSFVVADSVNATGGAGLALADGATANLSGVNLIGGDSEAWVAEEHSFALGGAALRLASSGLVTISGGTFTGGQGSADVLWPNFADATGQGGPALDVRGASTLTIDGGTFTGGFGSGIVNFFPGIPGKGIGGAALKITGPSTVTINAGDFSVGSSGAGTVPPTVPITTAEGAITVVGDASFDSMRLTINGGMSVGLHGLQTLGISPNATESRIDILGGHLNGNGGKDLSLANPHILTTIFGSDFLFNGNPIPLELVSARSGTLEGVLADGSSFEWTFERFNNAPLMLAAPCDLENTDVSNFVAAVLTQSIDPLDVCMYDTNLDGTLNGLDIQGFVERILGS